MEESMYRSEEVGLFLVWRKNNLLKSIGFISKYVVSFWLMVMVEMGRAVEQNLLLERYPQGWTSMRDVENFQNDMYDFYFGEGYDLEELEDEEEKYEQAVKKKIEQAKEIDAGIKPTIDVLHKRTMTRLPETENENLILSVLAFNAHQFTKCCWEYGIDMEKSFDDCFHEAASVFSVLRDAFVAKHKPETMEADEFIGKSLWNVQAKEIEILISTPSVDIRNLKDAYHSDNYWGMSIELCLNILRPKYQSYVDANVVPLLKAHANVSKGAALDLACWGIK
jgi:hypothetical protein